MKDSNKLTRRAFFRGALAAGGLLAAGGAGYRAVADRGDGHSDAGRSEARVERSATGTPPKERPNIVLVVAGGLGYDDLGCYGSLAIQTPHLDRMAQEGVLMTGFCSSASLCASSHAGVLTGRYPVRTHVTMPPRPAGCRTDLALGADGAYTHEVRGIPADEVLLPELLQRQGYRTALIGTWHLGGRPSHPPSQNGFDLLQGAHYGSDARRCTIHRHNEVEIPAPAGRGTLAQRLTQEATAFVRAKAGSPFFLYYAQPFPSVPLLAPSAFGNHSSAGLYGDAVQEIDWSAGQILDTLHELDLERDTLILFTSDNGPRWQGSAEDARRRKNLPFEGGLRVPLIARWPGVLPGGRINGEMGVHLDLFATCLSVAGIPLPSDRIIDGKNLLPVLRGEAPSAHEALYYYRGKRLLGLRQDKWKVLRCRMTDNGGYAGLRQGPFLFNLETDPNESYSLIGSEPEVARRLARMLDGQEEKIKRNPRGWL